MTEAAIDKLKLEADDSLRSGMWFSIRFAMPYWKARFRRGQG